MERICSFLYLPSALLLWSPTRPANVEESDPSLNPVHVVTQQILVQVLYPSTTFLTPSSRVSALADQHQLCEGICQVHSRLLHQLYHPLCPKFLVRGKLLSADSKHVIWTLTFAFSQLQHRDAGGDVVCIVSFMKPSSHGRHRNTCFTQTYLYQVGVDLSVFFS